MSLRALRAPVLAVYAAAIVVTLSGCEAEIVSSRPVAVCNGDQTGSLNQPVTLDGSASYVPGRTDPQLEYEWSVAVQPDGVSGASLPVIEDRAADRTSLTASVPGLYVVRLVVRHEGMESRPAFVNVRAFRVNEPPVAVIDPDHQQVDPGDPVVLDGSDSHDPEGKSISYGWRQLDGSPVALSPEGPLATFVAPRPAGTLRFGLTVTDSKGNSGEEATATVVVRDVPPVAQITGPLQADENSTIRLDGSSSSDDNLDPITAWQWSRLSGPEVVFDDPTQAAPTVRIPTFSGRDVRVVVGLVVTAGGVESAQVTHSMRLNDLVNEPPVADAGPDASVPEQSVATLDGSGSLDPNGDFVTWSWTQLAGPAPLTLSDPTVADPTFETPRVYEDTTWRFQLTVTDPGGKTGSDEVDVTVLNSVNEPPTASASGPGRAQVLSLVQLSGVGLDDNPGDQLTYAWTQTGGESVTLSDPTAAAPSFTAPSTPQLLEFALVVSDGKDASLPATVQIRVDPGPADPGTSTIALAHGSRTADGQQTTTATVTVRDAAGNLLTGKQVAVTTSAGTLVGSVTDEGDGRYTQVLRAPTQIGEAVVGFTVGGVAGTDTATLLFEPGPPAGTIGLTSVPASLVADGQSEGVITSDPVVDAFGNVVADGTLITVSTDKGTLLATDVSTSTPGVQLATASGGVSFGLRASTAAETATVTARSVTGAATGTLALPFDPGAPTGPIVLTPTPAVLTADGNSTASVVSGPIRDANGNPVENGTLVTVDAVGGTIPGHLDMDGTVQGIQVATSGGTLSFTVVAGTVAGPLEVSAQTVHGNATGTATLTLNPGLPAGTIALTATPATLVADGAATTTVTSQPIVDAHGNVVTDGTRITILASGGDLPPGQDQDGATAGVQVTTTAGVITVQARAGTTAGTLRIAAASVGGAAAGQVDVTLIPGPPAGTLSLTPSPAAVVANGASVSTITSSVIVDAFGNQVADGTLVTVSASAGTIVEADASGAVAGTQVGTVAGVVSFGLRSTPLAQVADVQAVTVQGGVTGVTTVRFVPGDPAGTLVLTATPASLTADGASTATVVSSTLTDVNGNVVPDGTAVTVGATGGVVPVAQDQGPQAGVQVLTSAGSITFTVRAGTTAAVMTVTAASVAGSASGSTTVDLLPGLPAGAITLHPSPASLVADGASRSTVTSDPITDAFGNAVADGTLVTVTAGAATIETADQSPLAGTQVVTAGGRISFTVRSGTAAGPVTLTAATVQGAASGSATLQLVPDVPVGTIVLTAAPTTLVANGTDQSTVTSDPITDTNGNVVLDGTLVTVSAVGGAVPSNQDQDLARAGVQVATSAGRLAFVVQAGTDAGTLQVEAASVAGSATGSVDLALVAGPPAGTVVLTASPASLTADGSGTTLITSGVVTDADGNPVADGTLFTVTASGGTLQAGQDQDGGRAGVQVATTAGVFQVTAVAGTAAGVLRVGAVSVIGSASGQVDVDLLPGPPAGTVVLTASPSSIVADGTSQSAIGSQPITDAHGNTVADGTLVTVETTAGTLAAADASADPGVQVVTSGGRISFRLTSGTAVETATVSASAGTATGSVQVGFVPGSPAGAIVLTATPATLVADGSSETTITSGQVKDAHGNVVADGTLITVSATGGTVPAGQDVGPGAGVQVATVNGTFSATVKAGFQTGTLTVTAASVQGTATGTVDVVLEPGAPAGSIPLTASPATLVADDTSTTAISGGPVRDLYNNVVAAGTRVTVTVTGGVVVAGQDVDPAAPDVQVATGADGRFTVTIRAGATADPMIVIASSVIGSAGGSTLVTLVPGDPAGAIVLTASPTVLEADGIATATVISDPIGDGNGNVVADGTLITVAATGGTVVATDASPAAGLQVATIGGRITFDLTAGNDASLDLVATADSVQGTAGGTVTIGLVPGPAAGTILLTASPATLTANGTDTATVSSDPITDASLNVVPDGTLVTVAVDPEAAITTADADVVTPGIQVATSGGQISFTVQAGTTVTTVTATADVDGASGGATLDLVAGPASILLLASGDGQTGPVGQPLTAPFVVDVQDDWGHPVSGATVTWAVSAGGGAVDPATSVSDASGQAQAVGTLGSTPGADNNVYTASLAAGASVTFTASAEGILTPSIAAAPATVPGDGTTASTVTVTLDLSGAPAPGYEVRLSTDFGLLTGAVDNGDGTVTAVDQGDGTYTATLTAGSMGTATVELTVDGVPTGTTTTVDFTNLAPVPNAGSDVADLWPWDTVVLDGSVTDGNPDDALVYAWTVESVPTGSAQAVIGPRTAANTPADAFAGTGAVDTEDAWFWPDVPGDYVLRLTVDDGHGAVFDEVTVSVDVFDALTPANIVNDTARSFVRDLDVTDDGFVGLATDDGALIFDPATSAFTHAACLTDLAGRTLASDGATFFYGAAGTVTRLDTAAACTAIDVVTALGATPGAIHDLEVGPTGYMAVATDKDLTAIAANATAAAGHAQFDSGTVSAYGAVMPAPSGDPVFVAHQGSGLYHVAATTDPLTLLDPAATEHDLGSSGITEILPGVAGATGYDMWLATAGTGVYRVTVDGGVTPSLPVTSTHDAMSLLTARRGNVDLGTGDLWLATEAGLARYKPELDAWFGIPAGTGGLCDSAKTGLKTPWSAAVHRSLAGDRTLYVGCENGLYRLYDPI